MNTLGAYIVAQNEEDFLDGCIERLKGVDQIVLVDNASTDKTWEIMQKYACDKVQIFQYPKTQDMGALRSFAISKLTTDWIWIVDADEWYEKGAVEALQRAINDPGEAISFRVGYHQLSWRAGFKQANFTHLPDRLYRRDVIDSTSGLLPIDMVKVKPAFYDYRPFLEYDNADDKSFENPKQPILSVKYYHLARKRGYNFELNKNIRYQVNGHPDWTLEQCEQMARINQWVTGLYDIEKIEVPFEVPPIKNPKVSVIIPNFQYKQFVKEAIDSIKNQTYPAHDLIVVDDGSHDDSQGYLRELNKDNSFILIEKENGGVAAARNAGTTRATGDYLLFLDADDRISPDFIEKTLQEMKGDVQVVYTDLQFFGDQDGCVGYPDFSLKELRKNQCIPSACALVDRRVFEQVGGFDNGEHYEDYGWWLRIATKGFNFKHIAEPLFFYRKHGPSRINLLDERQVEGFSQLRERYGKI